MSLVVFVIAPPVVLVLRKLIARMRNVATSQWIGGARTLETLQETVQGIRLVKSFTLEDQMRARFDANVAAVERESNKMARVASAPAAGRNAGRRRGRADHDLCRLSRHRYRRDARASSSRS